MAAEKWSTLMHVVAADYLVTRHAAYDRNAPINLEERMQEDSEDDRFSDPTWKGKDPVLPKRQRIPKPRVPSRRPSGKGVLARRTGPPPKGKPVVSKVYTGLDDIDMRMLNFVSLGELDRIKHATLL